MSVKYFLVGLLVSCASTPHDCVRDVCAEKAAQISAELAQAAAQQHVTPEEMKNEFIGVCQGQIQTDLDQTLPAILAVLDAGKDGSP